MLPMLRALNSSVQDVAGVRRTSQTVDIESAGIEFLVTQEYIDALFEKYAAYYGDPRFPDSGFKGLGKEELMKMFRDEWACMVTPKMSTEIFLWITARHNQGVVDSSSLYKSMIDWLPSTPNRNALIIVDVQNDFVNGSLAVKGAADIIPKINELRVALKCALVVHTLDWHPVKHCSFFTSHPGAENRTVIDYNGGKQMLWPEHCVQNSPGSDLHPSLTVEKTDYSVRKGTFIDVDSYSGFFDNDMKRETGLRVFLRKQGVGKVYVVGIAYDYCVGSTATHAARCGFSTTVVRDCTAAVDEDSAKAMDAQLQAADVTVTTSNRVRNAVAEGMEANLFVARYLKRKFTPTHFPGQTSAVF